MPLDPCKTTLSHTEVGSPQACATDRKAAQHLGSSHSSQTQSTSSEAGAAVGGGCGTAATAAAAAAAAAAAPESSGAVRRLPSTVSVSTSSVPSVHSVAASSVEGGEASPQAVWDRSLRVVAGYYSEVRWAWYAYFCWCGRVAGCVGLQLESGGRLLHRGTVGAWCALLHVWWGAWCVLVCVGVVLIYRVWDRSFSCALSHV